MQKSQNTTRLSDVPNHIVEAAQTIFVPTCPKCGSDGGFGSYGDATLIEIDPAEVMACTKCGESSFGEEVWDETEWLSYDDGDTVVELHPPSDTAVTHR